MSRKLILRIFFLLYCILLAITLWRHEMWRDELEAWNIAVASHSIADLFHNFQYEGHPVLWFVILWLLSKISHAPEMMQVINFLFAVTTAYVILFKSPFTILQKVLLVFGYYFLYEYAAISRNYMIEIMMVIIICSLWKNSTSNRKWLLLLLFMICQTNAFGYVFSFAFSFSLFVKERKEKQGVLLQASYLLVAAVGFLVAYLSSKLPHDSELHAYLSFHYDTNRLSQLLTNFWNGFFPVPQFHLPVWSELLLKVSPLAITLGSVLFLTLVIFSLKNVELLISFLLQAFLGTMALMYFVYPGFQRHHGHLFIAFVGFLWLCKNSAQVKTSKLREYFFNTLLIIHALIGLGFMITDWVLPFSNGKKVAKFIRENFPEQVVTGHTDCPMTTIAGYLQHDIYFVNHPRKASFVIYRAGRWNVEDSTICKNIFLLADSSSPLALVLNFNLKNSGQPILPLTAKDTTVNFNLNGSPKQFSISREKSFEGSMVRGEDYTVYEVEKK